MASQRHAWLQVAKGEVIVNQIPLATGDGLAVSEITNLEITTTELGGEILLFDLV